MRFSSGVSEHLTLVIVTASSRRSIWRKRATFFPGNTAAKRCTKACRTASLFCLMARLSCVNRCASESLRHR